MHMADALLSPAVGATFWAGSIATIVWCAKKLKENIDEKMIPLMGVLAAFIFAAQMINFTLPATGSSGHLGGGMILAILLGPYASFIAIASVLTIQSLFFADGGILALGCNIWNLGVYPCFIVYPLIYKPLAGESKSPKRIMWVSILSVIIALQMGAFSVVTQTMLSGKSELPFGTFLFLMQPIHLGIGIIEGFITAGVVNYVRSARPEILDSIAIKRPVSAGISFKKVVMTFMILTIVTGGALSWFASANPDGLEWSIEKVFGSPELPESEHGIVPVLKRVQEKTAFLPDYNFKESNGSPVEAWPNIATGTSLSGILGSLMVLSMVFIFGLGMKAIKKFKV